MHTAIESTATNLISSSVGKMGDGRPVGISPTILTLNFGPPRSKRYEREVKAETSKSSVGMGNLHHFVAHGLTTSFITTRKIMQTIEMYTALRFAWGRFKKMSRSERRILKAPRWRGMWRPKISLSWEVKTWTAEKIEMKINEQNIFVKFLTCCSCESVHQSFRQQRRKNAESKKAHYQMINATNHWNCCRHLNRSVRIYDSSLISDYCWTVHCTSAASCKTWIGICCDKLRSHDADYGKSSHAYMPWRSKEEVNEKWKKCHVQARNWRNARKKSISHALCERIKFQIASHYLQGGQWFHTCGMCIMATVNVYFWLKIASYYLLLISFYLWSPQRSHSWNFSELDTLEPT